MDTSVTTNDCNDLDLVRSGDLDAFGRIHDRHAALIFSVCRRHGPGGPYGSRTEAEDATQEVFIRAYRKLDAIDDCTRLAAWFCTIARFVVRERRRAMARRLKHEGEAMKSAIHAHGGADSISPSANPEREERFSALEAAMEQLPDEQRLAIHLHYLEHDPVDAAKRTLGLSRSGFYKLLGRARASLADLLRDIAPEDNR
ncbi:MAG: sigma-70 family RNA polymerase sigma factor [Phycisphaera sp.]|nr:sigma-70 family RNA polymerase sigma factor [Phycisphaera sp.]